MTITQISPHAWQLTRLGLINAYLCRESDGFTLIDTTISGAADSIMACARACATPDGLKTSYQICRVLLTHAHVDHIGSLDQLAYLLGNAHITISRREARLLPKPPAQDRSLDPTEPQCKVKGYLPGAVTTPTHFVSDGELYGSLRCFATPGHTPGHFSFLDERDGTLYSGDALVTLGGKPNVCGWGPWWMPSNLVTWHRPTARTSVQTLLSTATVPIQRIAPGHGSILDGGNDLLQSALNEAT